MSCLESAGAGQQPKVDLRHASGALAEIYLHGATVTRYASSSGTEVLWVSSCAVFDGKKGIRGGIPLVFPQFGPVADERLGVPSMVQHGFARTQAWALASTTVTPTGECEAVFSLSDTEASRLLWPHAFSLEYTVTLGASSLRTSLKATNLDDSGSVSPQALLHTYFRTPKPSGIADARVHGLESSEYIDSLDASQRKTETTPAVAFDGELDRIYQGVTRKKCALAVRHGAEQPGASLETYGCTLDGAGLVSGECAPDVVVWNPHVAKAKGMSDFDDEGWRSMLCVEPGLVAADRPAIPAKHAYILQQTIVPDDGEPAQP